MKALIILTFLLLSISFQAQTAQIQTIDNGGESVNNNQLQVIYTIGESFVNEFSNETLLVSEGFINSSILNASLSNNEYKQEGLSIYPNPTVDFLNVSYSSIKSRHYQVFNTLGQKIIETHLQGKTDNIDVRNLSKGIYFLVIQNKENNQFQKLKFIKK